MAKYDVAKRTEFHREVLKYLIDKSITTAELAESMGITTTMLSNMFRGERRVTDEMMTRLSRRLELMRGQRDELHQLASRISPIGAPVVRRFEGEPNNMKVVERIWRRPGDISNDKLERIMTILAD